MIIRWRATVFYRTKHGLVDIVHDMRELFDLHDLVELGPNWDTIERIEIVRAIESDLTTEEAAQR